MPCIALLLLRTRHDGGSSAPTPTPTMSGVLRAIPTRYKGILFRSKLEADWAITLDELGIEWEYEREGRYWGEVYYAPDFWLPDTQQWLEVKGVPTALDFDKWMALLVNWEPAPTEEWRGFLRVRLGTDIYHEVSRKLSPTRLPPLVIALPHGMIEVPSTVIEIHNSDDYPDSWEEVALLPNFGFLAHSTDQPPTRALQLMESHWSVVNPFPYRQRTARAG